MYIKIYQDISRWLLQLCENCSKSSCHKSRSMWSRYWIQRSSNQTKHSIQNLAVWTINIQTIRLYSSFRLKRQKGSTGHYVSVRHLRGIEKPCHEICLYFETQHVYESSTQGWPIFIRLLHITWSNIVAKESSVLADKLCSVHFLHGLPNP